MQPKERIGTTNITQGSGLAAESQVDRLLSIEAAADLLSSSPWTVRRWIQEGTIRSNKLGTRRLVPLSEVKRLIEESAVKRPCDSR